MTSAMSMFSLALMKPIIRFQYSFVFSTHTFQYVWTKAMHFLYASVAVNWFQRSCDCVEMAVTLRVRGENHAHILSAYVSTSNMKG